MFSVSQPHRSSNVLAHGSALPKARSASAGLESISKRGCNEDGKYLEHEYVYFNGSFFSMHRNIGKRQSDAEDLELG